ncbi:unnamed protein product [Choristocarpus tenellus]
MSTVGSLASYFRRKTPGPEKAPVEGDHGQVRARLGKKLDEQKRGFTFGFYLDEQTEQCFAPDASKEPQGFEFRFDLEGTETPDTFCGGGSNSTRGLSAYSQEIMGTSDRGNGNNNQGSSGANSKKGIKKKKKKKKKKKIQTEIKETGRVEGEGYGGESNDGKSGKSNVAPDNGTVVGTKASGTDRTSCVIGQEPSATTSSGLSSFLHEKLIVSNDPEQGLEHADAAQFPSETGCNQSVAPHELHASNTTHSPTASWAMPRPQPPPGLTLDSWKDPTLTDEERHRRRFGRGVRNMVAIQRSGETRRSIGLGGAIGPEVGSGICELPVGAGVASSEMAQAATESSSVFAFGFDIGITFGRS